MSTIDLKLKTYEQLQFEITKLNTDIFLKDKEIERLNKELEKYKYSADELYYIKELEERIDEAIYMIEDLMANNLEVHKGEPIIKVLKGSDKE